MRLFGGNFLRGPETRKWPLLLLKWRTSAVVNKYRASEFCNDVSGRKYEYDAAGNMTWDCDHSYTFDAEERVLTVDDTSASYTYDANGQRIRKDVGANWTEYLYFGGAVLSDITSSGTTDYIYNNGQLYARASGPDPASTCYYHQDHLGTSKLITDSSATVVSNCTYAPFGQQVNCSPDDANNHYRFTGDEYDAGVGNSTHAIPPASIEARKVALARSLFGKHRFGESAVDQQI